MKQCCTCLKILSDENFARDKNSWDGRGRQCKFCFSVYCAKRRGRNLEVIKAAKARPCMDCGIQYPHYVMDLDHRSEEVKIFILAKAKHKSLALVEAEIAKCDVVCANCHRMRTERRRLDALQGSITKG